MADELLFQFQDAVRGRYAVEAELGRGAMGVVFLARDLRLDRPVAIKVLAPTLATPDDRERFLREARLAARLSHPHVVPIHAVEEAGDFVYFAMMYVDGGTLGGKLAASGPMPVEEAGRLLREIAWALAYAHAQGIIHRDIKPDNILLEQGTRRALVTDFGIAKPEKDELGGSRLGTPGFASPEQATGDEADVRSDIYALGALGFCLLSGQPPFTGDARAIITRQLERAAPRVREVAPGTPRDLAAVVDRCLATDPARRYQTADELASAIGRALPAPRELPPALRTWVIGRPSMFFGVAALWLFPIGITVVTLIVAAFEMIQGDSVVETFRVLWEMLKLTGWAAGFTALFAASRTLELRKLMATGITLPQLRNALRMRNEQYDEENSAALLPSPWARRIWRLTQAHLGLALLALFGTMIGASSRFAFGNLIQTFLRPVGTYLLYSLTPLLTFSIFFPGRRIDVRPRLFTQRVRFWLGAGGDWMVRAAGYQLKRPEQLAGATANLPTELALEDAAIAIYDALPPAQRKALGDLKPTVERLARFAERERRAVSASPGSARRLAETIDALDTLRLGLLRLRAGSATLAGVTTDLRSARELSTQVDRLAEANFEVSRLLEPDAE